MAKRIISEETRKEVFQRYVDTGESMRVLGQQFNIDRQTISSIIREQRMKGSKDYPSTTFKVLWDNEASLDHLSKRLSVPRFRLRTQTYDWIIKGLIEPRVSDRKRFIQTMKENARELERIYKKVGEQYYLEELASYNYAINCMEKDYRAKRKEVEKSGN